MKFRISLYSDPSGKERNCLSASTNYSIFLAALLVGGLKFLLFESTVQKYVCINKSSWRLI